MITKSKPTLSNLILNSEQYRVIKDNKYTRYRFCIDIFSTIYNTHFQNNSSLSVRGITHNEKAFEAFQ